MVSPLPPERPAAPQQGGTYVGRPARRLPPQLLILMAITGSLMLIVWLKLASPTFSESQKARQTAQFYLDALGKAPLDKLGAELHPGPRSHFNLDSLGPHFKALGLDKPVSIGAWQDEAFDRKLGEWSWRVELSNDAGRFPLLLSVRQPQTQAIGRRWRVYSLCRPDLDLRAEAKGLLEGKREIPGKLDLAAFKAFRPLPQDRWQLVSTSPPSLIVPGAGGERLSLSWAMSPDGKLGCEYKLSAASLAAKGK